jgi:RNA polymerase sigma factor (sigma-70 family)
VRNEESIVNILPAAQAVEALIQEYGRLVFHTIYGLTGDWEESQDLTQDTFHQALKAIDAARTRSGAQFHAKAWLLRIALNTVLMQRRRQSLFRFIPFSRLQSQGRTTHEHDTDASALETLQELAAAVQPSGYGITQSEDLETRVAEQDAVRRTLARLSEPLRVCLLLSVVGQFSGGEIAAILKLEEATVRQRLVRARKQFQQLYRLESDEEVYDPVAQSGANRPAQANAENQDARAEPVEFRGLDCATHACPSARRGDHAERFYRNPALTPLR